MTGKPVASPSRFDPRQAVMLRADLHRRLKAVAADKLKPLQWTIDQAVHLYLLMHESQAVAIKEDNE